MINGPALLGFVTVAEVGSVHGAAQRLNISQTALTRRLQQLEASLGTDLFIRRGRRLTLSPQGVRLFSQCQPHVEGLLSALSTMREEASSGKASINFGCLPSVSRILLPEVVASFLQKRPKVRLRVYDSSANQVIGRVIDRTADFGVSLLGMVPAELSQEHLGDDPLVLLVHREHPFANAGTVTWRDLIGERLIAGGGPSGNRSLIESVRASIGIDLTWSHEVQHIPTAVEWTGAGVAHTIAPKLMFYDRIPQDVRCVSITSPPLSRSIGILSRAGERLSPEADILRRGIAARLRRKLLYADEVTRPDTAGAVRVRLDETALRG